jgi:hypothetical protein
MQDITLGTRGYEFIWYFMLLEYRHILFCRRQLIREARMQLVFHHSFNEQDGIEFDPFLILPIKRVEGIDLIQPLE